ncbi:ERF family protein [Virgibacillus pantothenticus]|uniref:ERF family protein n=2 Tax=Virgibacillus pantothenticus TaxID=1473 RepID=UPI00067D9121|nr:ERF family protein [Virgibacillus pantothenticus]QTY16913.1 ERF family protein [Virgibacillus pantothenticus]
MIFSKLNNEIAQAFSKAWAELENPKHNTTVKVNTKSGGSYTFEYTDLGGIFDEAKRVFKENEISIMQNASTREINGNLMISVETMLLHSSGQWIKSDPLQMPCSTNMQDMGGQITYMKRYSLSALIGIATEKDDDANGAVGNEYKMTNKGNKASDKQLDFVKKLLEGKVNEKNDFNTLYSYLKQSMDTDVDMENWTSQQASQAIKILKGGNTQ